MICNKKLDSFAFKNCVYSFIENCVKTSTMTNVHLSIVAPVYNSILNLDYANSIESLISESMQNHINKKTYEVYNLNDFTWNSIYDSVKSCIFNSTWYYVNNCISIPVMHSVCSIWDSVDMAIWHSSFVSINESIRLRRKYEI
jgi:hypothetical protein